jgi:hypothetical protein
LELVRRLGPQAHGHRVDQIHRLSTDGYARLITDRRAGQVFAAHPRRWD